MGAFFSRNYRIFFLVLLASIAGLSFYVGMLEGKQSKGDSVILACSDNVLSSLQIPTSTRNDVAPIATTSTVQQKGTYAGSKNGTKYYTPDCAGLKKIKPENIIWFQSVEDATLQGYSAANC